MRELENDDANRLTANIATTESTSEVSPFTMLVLIFEWNIKRLFLSGGRGLDDRVQAAIELFKIKADRIAADETKRIMSLPDGADREARLKCLRKQLDSFLDSLPPDTYSYREVMKKCCF